MPQVFLFRSELRQTCHPTTWRCYAAGDYFRDGGYRHGSATSQAVSRIWDMHGFQSDVHVDGSIGHITLDEGCYYGFQSHCITCIPRLESRAPKRFHPASLHTVEERMHDEVDPIADSEHTSIKKKKLMVVARDKGASRCAGVCATLVHEQHHKAATSNSF